MVEHECDLVMRGGVTSGVVYPKAIAKLAETYRFRAIGGTSAGAIAAVVTAAAEYRRQTTGKDSFQGRIAGIPDEMAAGRLLRLFQPQRETAELLRLLLAGLKEPRWLHVVLALPPTFPLGFLTGVAVAALIAISGEWWARLLGIALAIVLGLLGAVAQAAWHAMRTLPRSGYGICSGMGDKDALTPWLHKLIQGCAGRTVADPPLTFGELWSAGKGGAVGDRAERAIDLALITTNVTQGLPHRFPFLERSSREPLFFRREELEPLFPPEIVRWLLDHPSDRPINGGPLLEEPGYHRLSAPHDLPVLLGARFSLSFPFLLSAVPLWMPDLREAGSEQRRWRRCLFSDGGLTSNFPIHLFDAPIPGRPTFCINLRSAEVKVVDGNRRKAVPVWLPDQGGEGVVADFLHKDQSSLFSFFTSLFDTSRNWSDSELASMPGYRERIVHVHLRDDVGGMNLDMNAEAIGQLAGLGQEAAERLIERYDPEVPAGGLAYQRWVRLRSTLAALEVTVRAFKNRWDEAGYDRLLEGLTVGRQLGYNWASEAQRDHARSVIDAIGVLADTFDDAELTMDGDPDGRSPRAKPILRMMPPGSRDPRIERFLRDPLFSTADPVQKAAE